MIPNEVLEAIKHLPIKKLIIVGPPGSGKTTVGKSISESFKIPLIEADSFFWKENGEHLSENALIEAVAFAIQNQDAWVFEGHFKTCHAIVLKDASMVIEIKKNFWFSFFDYSWRELKRRDIKLITKFEKILFVPINYRRIQKTRKKALAGFSGIIIHISCS